jgi:hypothetical protein
MGGCSVLRHSLLLLHSVLLVNRQGGNKAPQGRWWVRLPRHDLEDSCDALKICGECRKVVLCYA